LKKGPVFFPARLRAIAQANAARYPWAAALMNQVVKAAEPWLKYSDDELWAMMFGPTITRSWMVWSNGYCPSCKASVPSYGWVVDAFALPWKVRCPHCHETFPKNDFYRFYRSGLDEHGIFNPRLADRALLFNSERPDPQDPLHPFGVDDGEGYVEGDRRWRFIGYYLIYGQWKQLVFGGIKKLAAAYALTGDLTYAHKAAVLLDRVADLYPSFDGLTQLLAYEKPHGPGYVSTWHDACMETRDLALAYDQIFEALAQDEQLVAFLSAKARAFGLPNPKSSWTDIQRNIEEGILKDALSQPLNPRNNKIAANPPQTDITLATIQMVLGWPENKEEVHAFLDQMFEQCTALDGLTGEKGLTNYSVWTSRSLFLFLEQCVRADPTMLETLFARHKNLSKAFGFFLDTWCLQKYYPTVGDSSPFFQAWDQYAAVICDPPGSSSATGTMKWWIQFTPALPVSGFTFLWRLYKITHDPAYIQALYRANDFRIEGLPYDLFVEDPGLIQREVKEVIDREGSLPRLGSVNKQQWRLAILRSGQGKDARAAWIHYDHVRGHGHHDGLNLGFYAKGLDLLPDFGYPPTHYGGWGIPQTVWYAMPASHNLVVVDGSPKQFVTEEMKTTLWVDGRWVKVIRISAPGLIAGQQFERTVALVDISARDAYLIDVFRVVGGTDHAKFTRSNFGSIAMNGLTLQPAEPFGHGTLMRDFYMDPMPQPGWSVDWNLGGLSREAGQGAEIHLRYTDLTPRAQVLCAEAWVSKTPPAFDTISYEDGWLPCVITRRQAQEGPLASTFVAVLEPYEGTPNIASIRRLPLEVGREGLDPDVNVALEIRLADGSRDLFILMDVEDPLGLNSHAKGQPIVQPDWKVSLGGEMCWVRCDPDGAVQRIVLGRGEAIRVGDLTMQWPHVAEGAEWLLYA
jgi:hypothetical protein